MLTAAAGVAALNTHLLWQLPGSPPSPPPLLQRPDTHFNVYISYLEIYNEAGYDLLDPSHETKSLEELP